MITKELPHEIQKKAKIKVQTPLPISDWLSELEGKRAKEFKRRTGLDYQTLLTQIIEVADLHPGMQVLELATGTGMIARHLVGLVGTDGKIIGVDRTTELVERARLDAQSAKVGTRIEWRTAPLNHLPFNDKQFDLVTCGLAFNQLEPKDIFREAYRILKTDSALLIAAELVPAAGLSDFIQKIRRQYYRYIKRNNEEANAHFYSSDELAEMLRGAGFRQIVIRSLKSKMGVTGRSFSLIRAVK